MVQRTSIRKPFFLAHFTVHREKTPPVSSVKVISNQTREVFVLFSKVEIKK